ncbi:unnamed protein product [Notodromas monacha]|uniref:Uncharacterized protein n=1 Tax=Notodromas monacha TaxID=399045 RepID=A0A7R9G9Q1_9CRUS|nr:unnamed protein product [Notodromas monacha]CAG0912834.1 unnamed protein product [Notodromas monacha]
MEKDFEAPGSPGGFPSAIDRWELRRIPGYADRRRGLFSDCRSCDRGMLLLLSPVSWSSFAVKRGQRVLVELQKVQRLLSITGLRAEVDLPSMRISALMACSFESSVQGDCHVPSRPCD